MVESSRTPKLHIVGKLPPEPAIELSNVNLWFNDNCVLSDISCKIPKGKITCIVGPSGAGKSTLLRSFNRIHDGTQGLFVKGETRILGQDIVSDFSDITKLRETVGMVFQRPCVFPRSILENVVFGLRNRKLSKPEKHAITEKALRASSLWPEVSDRLGDSALNLSLGQQQRLCIARSLAMKPEILLLDEPTASTDPVSTLKIEESLKNLAGEYTFVMVTHDIAQAKRIGDHVMFMCDGKLIEAGPQDHMFSCAAIKQTSEYLKGAVCDC